MRIASAHSISFIVGHAFSNRSTSFEAGSTLPSKDQLSITTLDCMSGRAVGGSIDREFRNGGTWVRNAFLHYNRCLTADTNVLVRGVVRDDARQARAAERVLRSASVVAVALPCLCEFVWVLRGVYRFQTEDISAAIRALHAAGNVEMNRPAVEAGLALLDAGGDFADGVIAYEGRWLGGDTFVSFDKTSVTLLSGKGYEARSLS